jgi:hypothetical protein
MKLEHKVVVDENGQPEAALIPWKAFVEIRETLGDAEPTEEEIKACREAEADRQAGNWDAFVPLSETKARLGLG